MSRVMVISPHHDDEVIGCGGTIYRHKQKDDQVAVVFMMAGWSGIPWEPDHQVAASIIQEEAKNAGSTLGIDTIKELNLEDRNLSMGSALKPLITAIREESPDIIYLPYALDGDLEHRLTSEIGRQAIWMASSDYLPELGLKAGPIKNVFGYEVWRPMATYNLVIDITTAVNIKLAALNRYQSQLKTKDWQDAALGLNRFRGVTSGKGKYAEVYEVLKINEQFII